MYKLLSKTLTASLLASSAQAMEFSVALPETLPEGPEAVQSELWSFFTQDIGPGDSLYVHNASDPGEIAVIHIPDDPRFERAKWRIKRFAKDARAVGTFVKSISSGDAGTDLTGLLRHEATSRLDLEAERHLLFIGSVVNSSADRDPTDPTFDLRKGETLRVPSPAHIHQPLSISPWGMGAAGPTGLQNVSVHICPMGDALSSDEEAAYQQFWSHYIAARGGTLVSWGDNLPSCFTRFAAQASTPLTVEPFVEPHGTGAVEMREINRGAVGSTAVTGASVARFNLFASKPHPSLKGVEVTTGTLYVQDNYPDRFESAWCYFNVTKSGITQRFDLGTKTYGKPVEHGNATTSALRASGISSAAFEAGKTVCQWPTS